MDEYGISMLPYASTYDADCVILAVAHADFRSLTLQEFGRMFRPAGEKVLIDVKGILDKAEAEKAGFRYWRL